MIIDGGDILPHSPTTRGFLVIFSWGTPRVSGCVALPLEAGPDFTESGPLGAARTWLRLGDSTKQASAFLLHIHDKYLHQSSAQVGSS
jgi:hypothetical protein